MSGVEADVYLTGEMSHHEVLGCNAAGASVILTDHSNTERGFLQVLRQRLQEELPGIEVAVSKVDHDPLLVV